MELQEHREILNEDVIALQKILSGKQRELFLLDKCIELQKREITITDNALLKYLEIVMDIDLRQIRKKILSDSICLAIEGGATEVIVDNVIFKVKDKIITTVY